MNTQLEATLDENADAFVDNEFVDNEPKWPARILVVDDDVDIRNLVIEALVRAGYEVDDAENGARAWKALHLKRYDLLLTDHNMPEMTGLQLIYRARASGFALPVILASGSLPPDLIARDPQLRLNAILHKPFTLDQLIRTVKEILPAPASDFDSEPQSSLVDEAVCHESCGHK
jgi:CheY-like chemotaxis protein